MARKHMAGFALAATTLLIAGCGGSSTKSASTSGTSTAAEQPASTSSVPATSKPATSKPLTPFIAGANAICRRLNTRSGEIIVKTRQDIARAMPRLEVYERTALAELSKLTPPKGKARDWKAILVDLRMVATEVRAMGRYAQHNDSSSIERTKTNIDNFEQHRIAIAARDHIADCSTL